MRPEDFIVEFLEIGKDSPQKVNLETAKMLGSILDTSKDGYVRLLWSLFDETE